MSSLERETQEARDAYLKAMMDLNAATNRGLEAERIQFLRSTLEETVALHEAHYGIELGLRLQLSYLQALPLFVRSSKTVKEAIVFVDNIVAPLHLKVVSSSREAGSVGLYPATQTNQLALQYSVSPAVTGAFGTPNSALGISQPFTGDEGSKKSTGRKKLKASSDGTRRDGRRPVKSAVKKEEITALFFKNAVEPGTLLKTLFEKVSNDYNDHVATGPDDARDYKYMSRWWYRKFSLEDFDGLGELKTRYQLDQTHYDAMKKFYEEWKKTNEISKAKHNLKKKSQVVGAPSAGRQIERGFAHVIDPSMVDKERALKTRKEDTEDSDLHSDEDYERDSDGGERKDRRRQTHKSHKRHRSHHKRSSKSSRRSRRHSSTSSYSSDSEDGDGSRQKQRRLSDSSSEPEDQKRARTSDSGDD